MSFSLQHLAGFRRVTTTAGLSLLLLSAFAADTCCGQESQLGSTATLEQIRKGRQDEPAEPAVPKIPRETDLVTEPAAAPAMKLEHRFWPNELTLKPGTAVVHLDRALLSYQKLGQPTLQEWTKYQVALGDASPDPADLTKRLQMFEQVYKELERFAECEDQNWDLRLRDLQYQEFFGFLLPEVQEYRELARLLRFRALEQLGRKDFAGAIATIRCGYRLAAFVRQGETLIQQFVGIAVEGIMQGCVEEAIRTPGCPNLYFALATVPQERRSMLRALEFEMSSIERALPIFRNPAEQTWDEETWKRQWTETAEQLNKMAEITGSQGGSGLGSGLKLLLAAELASDARGARKRLVEAGFAAEKVAAMGAHQILAIDASRQIQMVGQDLLAACMQPFPAASQAVSNVLERYGKEPNSNLGKVLNNLLLPAVNAALAAEMRVQAMQRRLLTMEAVRHFAATHGGRLPKDLAELTDLPPHVDPHTGKLIGYEVKSGPNGDYAEFSVQAQLPDEMKQRRLRFRK